jgi:SP family general alpha glucoside:H+ symporter-like MFS transporter
MLSAQDWNWGARCGLFWLGTNLVSILYCYLRLPESKNRTYGELDILFVS